MKRDKGCKDLPIYPDPDGGDEEESIISKYVAELRKVRSKPSLARFVERWKAVLQLVDPGAPEMFDVEVRLVEGTYDLRQVFSCLRKNRRKNGPFCKHFYREERCESHFILLPPTLLRATMISDKYGVPSDVVLHRLCGEHAFENEAVINAHHSR